MRSISDRLAAIESRHAIEALVHTYAKFCDTATGDDIANLFTEDALWSAASFDGSIDFGQHIGKDAISRFFNSIRSTFGPRTMHCVMAPDITINPDGRSAIGHWYTLVLLDVTDEAHVRHLTLIGSEYQHEYRLVDGRWLFAHLAGHIRFQKEL